MKILIYLNSLVKDGSLTLIFPLDEGYIVPREHSFLPDEISFLLDDPV